MDQNQVWEEQHGERESVWKDKYKNLRQYYSMEYNAKYFSLTPEEMEIDPDETLAEMEEYDEDRQAEEIEKCFTNFAYFCHKYVKIGHPTKGLVPFVLFDYQRRVIGDFEDYRFNIVSKFRQGGLSTVAVIWALWRGMFRFNETIMLLSKADREAIAAGDIAVRAMRFLPDWLRPEMTTSNKHEQGFAQTGTNLFFYTPNAARSKAITYLILDEAAFIPNMTEHWKAMYPTIATGGNCIAISTVNGVGNWYEETYHRAQEGKNPFHIIELDYNEHPDYDNDKWVRETRANLTEKGWRQEVLRDFLGSGTTYIHPDIIRELGKNVRDIKPIRKLFPEFNNTDKSELIDDWGDKGALWVFREPVDGRDYILGVDAAEGVGDDGDNSCIQVIDSQTCEQVCEFYSNNCPTNKFAKIVEQIGIYYNNGLIVVENMGGAGLAILMKLQTEYYYDNLYFENARNLEKAGVKVGRNNRPLILESLQSRLLNKSLPVASTRFVRELDTFIWNKQTQKAEAQKGKHDDSIMAMAHAIFVRDQTMRQPTFLPTDPIPDITDSFKLDMYEQIKQEIARGAPEDWINAAERSITAMPDDEDQFAVYYSTHRACDSILKEFGWGLIPFFLNIHYFISLLPNWLV
jgi:hypothetical protein